MITSISSVNQGVWLSSENGTLGSINGLKVLMRYETRVNENSIVRKMEIENIDLRWNA